MDLLNLLVWIIVVGMIFGLLWWLIDYIGLPHPFAKIAKVLIAVVAVVLMINVLLGALGTPMLRIGG